MDNTQPEQVNSPFDIMGVQDLELGVKLHQSLKLGPAEFKDASKLKRLQDIVKFLNVHPDPLFTIDSVTRSNSNPERSNLDHLWTYSVLKTDQMEANEKLSRIKKELTFYGE